MWKGYLTRVVKEWIELHIECTDSFWKYHGETRVLSAGKQSADWNGRQKKECGFPTVRLWIRGALHKQHVFLNKHDKGKNKNCNQLVPCSRIIQGLRSALTVSRCHGDFFSNVLACDDNADSWTVINSLPDLEGKNYRINSIWRNIWRNMEQSTINALSNQCSNRFLERLKVFSDRFHQPILDKDL